MLTHELSPSDATGGRAAAAHLYSIPLGARNQSTSTRTTIKRVVMVPGERFIDRETMGDMLFYSQELERPSFTRTGNRGRR